MANKGVQPFFCVMGSIKKYWCLCDMPWSPISLFFITNISTIIQFNLLFILKPQDVNQEENIQTW